MNEDWTDEFIDEQEKADAIHLLNYLDLRTKAKGKNALGSQSWEWIEGFVVRLNEQLGQMDETRTAVRQLRIAVDARRRNNFPNTQQALGRYMLHQQGSQLEFHPQSPKSIPKGSFVAQLESRDTYLEITPEKQIFWLNDTPPTWADP